MNDTLHRTDTLNPFKNVTCGKQKDYWVEFQLLDELGEPVANMPYRAINEATRTGYGDVLRGQPFVMPWRATPVRQVLRVRV